MNAMKHRRTLFGALILLVLLGVGAVMPSAQQSTSVSTWVFFGDDHRLHYQSDANGNRIMDFSSAGYGGGGVRIPTVPTALTIAASGSDDTAAIQAALDQVSQLPLGADGMRGAVLLQPGHYNVSSTLTIAASGVVLRGTGSGANGSYRSVITMTGDPFLFIRINGTGNWQTNGASSAMTDSYVPSGASSFNVADASGFHVGDTILVRRPVTAAWIHLLGMDTLVRSGAPQTWIAPGSTITTDRTITAINGTQVTLDVPLTDNFDATYLNPPGGSIAAYTFPGRISNVGAEHLAVIAHPANVDITQPQYQGVTMAAVINGWIQDVLFQDTQNTFQISSNVKQTTFDHIAVRHTVAHTGDGPADFAFSGTQLLFSNDSVTGEGGTWPAVSQSRVTGPVVLLDFMADDRGFDPHQRWATGMLCDRCNLTNSHTADKAGVAYSNRGNLGSGQGWDAGWSVAWNTTATTFLIQQPPGSQNFCIGCTGTILSEAQPGTSSPLLPNGIYDSLSAPVDPSSLYLQQLCDRLGPSAVANIGYPGTCAAPVTPSATGAP